MTAIESIVPGFVDALGRAPVTLATHRKLAAALRDTPLTERSRALIAVAIAQQLRCEYCIWVHSCLAEAAGVGAEDIFLARTGTALDRDEAALVKMACEVVAGGIFRNRLDPEASRRLGGPRATAVVTEVALAIVNCYVLQSIAPMTRDTVDTGRAG
jgi:AhpD family alkylhydroperoxidase